MSEETSFNGVTVYIQTVDDVQSSNKGPAKSSAKSKAKELLTDDLMDQAADIIKGIAAKIPESAKNTINPPSEIKVSFSLGVTSELNAWIIKGSGDASFNVEMTWKND